jgi:hypothetical protein
MVMVRQAEFIFVAVVFVLAFLGLVSLFGGDFSFEANED